jgi:hypothetical protein
LKKGKKTTDKVNSDVNNFNNKHGVGVGDNIDNVLSGNYPSTTQTLQSLGDDGNLKCIYHGRTFRDTVEELLEQEQPGMYVQFQMQKTVRNKKNVLDNILNVMDTQIASNYRTPNGIVFNRLKPEGSLLPIEEEDPDTRPTDEEKAANGRIDNIQPDDRKGFVDGAVDVTLKELHEFTRQMDILLEDWSQREEVLCCFIYNLLIITKGEDMAGSKLKIGSKNHNLSKGLKVLKGALEAILALYMVNWKQTFLAEKDAILQLLQDTAYQILQSLATLLTGELRKSLDKWLEKSLVFKRSAGLVELRRCPPFDELFLNILPNTLDDLLRGLANYLKSFWDEASRSNRRDGESIEASKLILRLLAIIDALDKVISFLDFWAECTEDLKSPDVEDIKTAIDEQNSLGFSPKANSFLQKPSEITTISKSRGLETIKAEQLNEFKETLRQFMEPDRSVAFTSDTVKLLLTNFMGVSPETVDAAIEDVDGECRCKNGFRHEEIAPFQGLF